MNSTNASNATSDEGKIEVLYFTIKAVICVITIIGNALVIFLIIRCRRLRVLPNTFIVSLAIADLMAGVVITPTETVCNYLQGQCDSIKQGLTFDILYHLSATNICALTLDRYIATERPLQYNLIMTKTKVAVILVIAWISAAVIEITAYVLFVNGLPYDSLQILDLILLQILPPILLVIAYMRMAYIVARIKKKQSKQISQINYNYGERESRHTKASATVKITGVIIIVFVVCYFLAVVRRLYQLFGNKRFPYPAVQKISRILLNINSGINVFVYALMKGDIKQELQRNLKCILIFIPRFYSTDSSAEQLEMKTI